MDLEQFRDYCLSKAGVTEEFPFGEQTFVYKVMGKMFALMDASHFDSVNLKCEPEKAAALREEYHSVKPGYHMNKNHWNTVEINTGIPDHLILEWVDHSYDLVVSGLPKKLRADMPNRPGKQKP